MPRIANRLDNFTESVIREMTRVANLHGAINLPQGFPDFPPAAAQEALDGNYHKVSWLLQNSKRPPAYFYTIRDFWSKRTKPYAKLKRTPSFIVHFL
ncbi:MAG TPA: hypothetical protein PLD25_32165 [Chloroflexota bacterium]|nr:hypothetical protein [Chloroflexota bacterium]